MSLCGVKSLCLLLQRAGSGKGVGNRKKEGDEGEPADDINWDEIIAIAFGLCNLSYKEFWDEVTYYELLQIYRGYQLKMFDQYEIAAWIIANLAGDKKTTVRKLFNKDKEIKRLFGGDKPDYDEMKRKYLLAKEIAQELKGGGRNGNRGES